MIERTAGGIPHRHMNGAIMAALAAFPVIVRDQERGYLVAGLNGFTAAANLAGRMTLAEAYFAVTPLSEKAHLLYFPIDYVKLDLPLPPSTNALFVEAPSRTAKEYM